MQREGNHLADQPLTRRAFLQQEAEAARQAEIERQRPLKEAEANLIASHRQLFEFQKAEISAGRPDPEWELPESARGIKFAGADKTEQAKDFIRAQSLLFIEKNSQYLAISQNFEKIVGYLTTNGVIVPNAETFQRAYERLRFFGLLEERPNPTPAPEVVPQEPTEAPKPTETDAVDGWDRDGLPRKFTQNEIFRMSADAYRKAFRVSPRFTRSRYE